MAGQSIYQIVKKSHHKIIGMIKRPDYFGVGFMKNSFEKKSSGRAMTLLYIKWGAATELLLARYLYIQCDAIRWEQFMQRCRLRLKQL